MKTKEHLWYKPVQITAVTEQKLQACDLSSEDKKKLETIFKKAEVGHFKNDCGDLGVNYVHIIERGIHPQSDKIPEIQGQWKKWL